MSKVRNSANLSDGKKHGEFHVVICGKAVTDLTNNSDLDEILRKAKSKYHLFGGFYCAELEAVFSEIVL